MKLFYTHVHFGAFQHIVRADDWQPGNRALCGYVARGRWHTVATAAGGLPVCGKCQRERERLSKVKGE